MVTLIVILHVVVCMFLIIVVLLQSGKAGDIAAAFGGQGSQTAFGPRGGATLLSKATTWSAIIFMLTSITLSIYSSRRPTSSILNTPGQTQQRQTPAPQKTPGQPPTTPQQPVPQK